MLQLKIDNHARAPIYRQISDQIVLLIRSGRLSDGDHLPTERDLALQLQVARGTVKKAYEILVQQNYVVASRGRGSVVKSGAAAVPAARHEQAAGRIAEAILALEDLGFSYREIADLFGLMLARRQEEVARFAIASVDCNPEALGIYQKQLAMLTHMSTSRILLSELRQAGSPDAMLAPFDIILTTANHYEELRQLAPGVAHKVVQVIVAPTQATLIALARLEAGGTAGIVHQSSRFFEIIVGWLKKSGFQGQAKGFNTGLGSAEELDSFVSDKATLIMPPGYAAQLAHDYLRVINRFRLNGGQLIDFDYQIERGSLLHLEDLIKSLLNKSRK